MKTAEVVQVKKGKSVIKFDNTKRVEYVTGFGKRAKERKEQAKKYHEAKLKKAKLEARAMRRKAAEDLMSRWEQEKEEGEEASSEEEDEEPQAAADPLAAKPLQTTVTECGGATVEVSELSLKSDHFQGANVDFGTCKLKATSIFKRGNLSQKSSNAPKKGIDVADKPFNDLVKGAIKTLQKKTRKLTDGVGKKKAKGGKKFKKAKSSQKNKPMVTHL